MSKKRGPLTPKTKQVVLKMVISVDANGVGACELDTNGLTHNNDVNILALAEAQLGFRELTMARTIEETFGRDDAKQFLETIQKKTAELMATCIEQLGLPAAKMDTCPAIQEGERLN